MTTRTNIQQFVNTTQPTGNSILGDEWFNPSTQKYYKLTPVNGVPTWLEIPILSTSSSITLTGNITFGNPPDTFQYDPYFNKVDVLMHFDGDLVNSAPGGGLGNGVAVGTSMGKSTGLFSTGTVVSPTGINGAIRFTGVTTNYVQIGAFAPNQVNNSSAMTHDFTIETWFRFDESAVGSLFYRYIFAGHRSTTSNGFTCYIYNQSTVYFGGYDASTNFALPAALGTNFIAGRWYHIALARQAGNIRAFINGILCTTYSYSNPVSGPWRIGADTGSYSFVGSIDEFRVTRDVARYTTNFQPLVTHTRPFPDQPYPQSLIVNYPTVSTSTTTGALVISGGIGSQGDVNASGVIRSWSSIRAPYFFATGAGAAQALYTNPYTPANFQVRSPSSLIGDQYGIPQNAGLSWDPVNNYTYVSNSDGNIINSIYLLGPSAGVGWYTNGSGYFTMPSSSAFNFTDVYIGRDGTAGQIGIRRAAASPASLYVYNTDGATAAYTSPTNYERAVLDWQATTNFLTIGVQAGGTGAGRNIRIVTGSLTTGSVTIVPTTASTSTNTGALIVQGGIATWGNINAGGSLTAVSKSFLIDHPTKPGMNLQYGSLEGPENGVYVRGRLTDVNVINLPDYWNGLVDEKTITASLTPIGRSQNVWIETITNNQIIVGHTDPIDCYYTVYGERKDIGKLIVEFNK